MITASSASATLIASFSFNQLTDSGPQATPLYADTPSLAGGNSAATVSNYSFSTTGFTSTTGTTVNSNVENPNTTATSNNRALALASEGTKNNNSSIQFRFSTSGYTAISFSYATERLAKSAFATETLAYSANHSGFMPLGASPDVTVQNGTITTPSFSGISALNNIADLIIQITFTDASGTTGGADLIDNVEITGTSATPELNSNVLFSAAALSATLVRLRRPQPAPAQRIVA